MTQILTITGLWYDFANPQVDQINLFDIAWPLSMLPRYNGHSKVHYSVAQHSCLVSDIVAEWGGTPLEIMHGLIHDFPEAYTGDIVSPLKDMLIGIHEIEQASFNTICKAFSIPLLKDYSIIKKADKHMYEVERSSGFVNNIDGNPYTGLIVTPVNQRLAFRILLDKFISLHERI